MSKVTKIYAKHRLPVKRVEISTLFLFWERSLPQVETTFTLATY